MSNDHASVASGNRHIAPFLPSNSQVTEESLRPAQMVLKSLNLLTPLLWVPPGVYDVEANHAGFKTTTTPRVQLWVQQSLRLDFTLAIDETTQSVTVTSPIRGRDSAWSRPLAATPQTEGRLGKAQLEDHGNIRRWYHAERRPLNPQTCRRLREAHLLR